MSARQRLDIAVEQLQFARRYTLQLIEDLGEDEWFAQPAGCPTHVAWQVGHLAMAEYGLTMLRVRGKQPEDQALIPNDFIRRFQKGTQAEPDRSRYPEPAHIGQTLERVHRRALDELSGYTDAELDVKLPEPHAVFDTKLGSVFFCPSHEMLHAGQLGLLRRLLGHAPLR